MDLHSYLCSCPSCMGGSRDGASSAGSTSDTTSSGASKPALSLAGVIYQLTTQWGGDYEGTTQTWRSASVNYAMPDTAPSGTEASGFRVMTPSMKAAAREAFELWDDLIAINLNESTSSTADITFAYSSNTGGGTYARTWSGNPVGTDYGISKSQIWFAHDWWTHDQDSDLYYGGYGIMTYVHEIGHALGLSHPGTYNAGQGSPTYASSAEYAQDTRQYTVMSYWDADEGDPSVDHWGSDGWWTYASTPLLHDIAAAQAKYGADMTTRTGDTVYGFNATAGRDVFNFARNPDPVVAIWDAAGTDTLDASGYATHQRIDLTPGSISSIGHLTGNVAIAHGAWIENAIGGGGDDVIVGNAVGNVLRGNAGNDVLWGVGGNNILIGGSGDNFLYGGPGLDTAIFDGLRREHMISGATTVASAQGTNTMSDVDAFHFVDGRLVFHAQDATAVVYRLYDTVFDRAPDSFGFSGWIEAVKGGASVQKIAADFLASSEFTAKFGQLSDAEFVRQLYRSALGREGEDAGVQSWVNWMEGGATRADVVAGFSEAAEHLVRTQSVIGLGLWDQDETTVSVARLYSAALDRNPDSGGLIGWTDAVKSGATTLADAADGFVFSAEFQGKYGALSDRGFIEHLYRNVLDREGDAGGLDHWTKLIETGQMDRGDVLLGFSESLEHQYKLQPSMDDGVLVI